MDRHVTDVVDEEPDGVEEPLRPSRQVRVGLRARAEVAEPELSPELAERRPLLGIRDDHEVPVLLVARDGRLLREQEALFEHVPLDGPLEIEPPPYGTRRREQLVDRQRQDHLPTIARLRRSCTRAQLHAAKIRADERLELDVEPGAELFERSCDQSPVHGADDLRMLLRKVVIRAAP